MPVGVGEVNGDRWHLDEDHSLVVIVLQKIPVVQAIDHYYCHKIAFQLPAEHR